MDSGSAGVGRNRNATKPGRGTDSTTYIRFHRPAHPLLICASQFVSDGAAIDLRLPRHIGSGQFREELSNWPKIPGENNERHKGRSWRGNDACSIEAEFRTLGVAAVRLEEA